MVSAHFLEHHGVGVGVGEKFRHLVHAVVVEPEIERDDAQEARDCRARRRRRRPASAAMTSLTLTAARTAAASTRRPIARGQRETEKGDGARGHEQQAVIDEIERGPPAREHAEQGQAGAQREARDDHSLQPSFHGQTLGFSRRGRAQCGSGSYMRGAFPASEPLSPMNDSPSDKEKNRFSARALRYGKVGANVGGVAARIAGRRLFGLEPETGKDAVALAAALGGLKGPIMKVAQLLATIPEALACRICRRARPASESGAADGLAVRAAAHGGRAWARLGSEVRAFRRMKRRRRPRSARCIAREP